MVPRVCSWQVRSAFRGPLSTPLEGIARSSVRVQNSGIQVSSAAVSNHIDSDSEELASESVGFESGELSGNASTSGSAGESAEVEEVMQDSGSLHHAILEQLRRDGAYWLA